MPLYGQGLRSIIDGTIDLLTDTIKVMLVTSSYTFDVDHNFADDVDAFELSGTGYTAGFGGAGRKTTASKTVTDVTASNVVSFDFADLTWTGLAAAAGTIGGAVLLKETTNDAASRIIGFMDPTNLVPNGGDVTLVVDSTGAITWTYG